MATISLEEGYDRLKSLLQKKDKEFEEIASLALGMLEHMSSYYSTVYLQSIYGMDSNPALNKGKLLTINSRTGKDRDIVTIDVKNEIAMELHRMVLLYIEDALKFLIKIERSSEESLYNIAYFYNTVGQDTQAWSKLEDLFLEWCEINPRHQTDQKILSLCTKIRTNLNIT